MITGLRVLKLLISVAAVNQVWAQTTDSLAVASRHSATYGVEVAGLAASATRTPFWLRANQFGVVPVSSPAGLAIVQTTGRYGLSAAHPNRQLSYGVEVVGNAAPQSRVLIPQAYVSLDMGRFSLWGGRKKEIIGLGDSTLTSGFYAWSGNALPITKVQIGTRGFAPLGLTRGLVSINAFFAHGWFANTDSIQGSFLHQKAVYVRIGRPNSRLRFTGGVLHNAQWGGRSATLPKTLAINGQLPSSFQDYLYVLTAREGGESDSPNLTDFDRLNRVGNHLGSIDFALETTVARWQLMGYYQHPFEDKSGVVFVNMPDGLYGLRLKRQPGTGFGVDNLLIEYLTTLSQSGSITGTVRYDGKDDYFNNYQYRDGWVQDRNVIGTPFFAQLRDVRTDVPFSVNYNVLAIASNRVELIHLGLAGSAGERTRWQLKLSASQHYGAPRRVFSRAVPQFSGLASVSWPLNWLGGSELRTAVALDQGELYTNSLGGWISLRKTWTTSRP